MHSPYGLEVNDSSVECKVRSADHFCSFDDDLLKSFEALKYATVFPKGAVLFVEGQSPRGVFMLCSGRVKLTTCSMDGKALIIQAFTGQIVTTVTAERDDGHILNSTNRLYWKHGLRTVIARQRRKRPRRAQFKRHEIQEVEQS